MTFAVEVGDVRLNGEHVESWDGKYWVFREVAAAPVFPSIAEQMARDGERRQAYEREKQERMRLIAEAEAAEKARLDALVGSRLLDYKRGEDSIVLSFLGGVSIRVALNDPGCGCCGSASMDLSIEGTE